MSSTHEIDRHRLIVIIDVWCGKIGLGGSVHNGIIASAQFRLCKIAVMASQRNKGRGTVGTYTLALETKRKWSAVVWTAVFLVVVLFALVASPFAYGNGQASKKTTVKNAGSTLKIIKDDLFKQGHFYLVKGSIYNPNAKAVKNVVIRYYIWKKFIGHDDRGSVVKRGGGLVLARINYLPPKQTVEFTTDAGAPIYVDVEPDPLKAEISADWDQ
jgi:hypothetical protein